MFSIRAAQPSEAESVASLIFRSTNNWYEGHGFGKIFQGPVEDCRLFFDVYEDLDPGCCLVALDDISGQIVGSCFYHHRETHFSLGIMNSDSTYAGKGVAKALLSEILAIANRAGKPVRLFSSAMNLNSYSLYTRQGFAPYAVFQDLLISVPAEGISLSGISTSQVRPATLDDLPVIVQLEQEIWGINRVGDWRYFIENQRGIWNVLIHESEREITGVLGSVYHPASHLLGPGVTRTATVAASLIVARLNQLRGETFVFLIPANSLELVHFMYQLGARNCELHFGQSYGPPPKIKGIVLPTFMPETG